MERTVLRACAQAALGQREFEVEPLTRPGVVPGARLYATKGEKRRLIAVRTSSDRNVRLLRRPDGQWRTIADVDGVIVAAPAEEGPDTVDVYGFKPESILEFFGRALEVQRKRNSNLSDDLPVRVALDQSRNGSGKSISGLKDKALWHETIRIDERIIALSKELDAAAAKKARTAIGFVERVKREFAELNGVDVSKVTIHLRIED